LNQSKTVLEETLMKNASVTMTLVALFFAGSAKPQNITITWQVNGKAIGTGYLPKLSSDGIQNVVAMDQINQGPKSTLNGLPDGVSAFQSKIGTIDTASISWTGGWNYLYSPPQKTPQIGLVPSIALAYDSADNYDNAVEVHQGAQESDGELWYQLGTNPPPFFGDIVWSSALPYGHGYNATVAADLNGKSATTTTVVEVHQQAKGESALWYQVGVLTQGPSPSIKWGATQEINGGINQGSVPTVSISNNVAVLVAQGTPGALWYAIGVVDTATYTINWTDPISYGGGGYNPTVSLWGKGLSSGVGKGRVVVEAHQMDAGTGSLVYTVGLLKNGSGGSAPTSIDWSIDTNVPYANGCYPSVAISFDGYTPPNQNGNTSNLSLTETHEIACGTSTIEYKFGYLVSSI
jgi:hypothetical protein